MALIITDNQHYSDIASAIRTKLGTNETFAPAEMASAILSISGGGGSVTQDQDGYIVLPSDGGGGGGGGGGDFSTTSVDIVNDTGTPQLEVRVPCIVNGEIRDFAYIDIEGGTLSVVMYKGKCEMWGGAYDVSAVSGSAVLDDGIAYISGNATVTFSD